MYKIKFTEGAAKEIENAGLWYSEKQYGLDRRFNKSISSAIEKLQSDKVVYGPVYRGLSRVFVKNFPYQIYFKKD